MIGTNNFQHVVSTRWAYLWLTTRTSLSCRCQRYECYVFLMQTPTGFFY